MNTFNRIVALVLWLALLAAVSVTAAAPLSTLQWLQSTLARAEMYLAQQQLENSTNFLIGQTAVAVGAVLLFGFLVVLEVWTARSHGVRIRTAQGGSAQLDTGSIGRRLSWRLDQLAEVITVLPSVRQRKSWVCWKSEICPMVPKSTKRFRRVRACSVWKRIPRGVIRSSVWRRK